jgi:hypothetical protein
VFFIQGSSRGGRPAGPRVCAPGCICGTGE